MFKILKMFRDNEDPEMGYVDAKAFETLSKTECLKIINKYGINGIKLCRMGNIDPSPECLCRLAYFRARCARKWGAPQKYQSRGSQQGKRLRRKKSQR